MARVNILKQVKLEQHWSLIAIPRNTKGDYDWQALPEGRYFVEWYERGKRKREAGGATAAEALEVARRRRHVLEGRALGLIKDPDGEEAKRTTVHVAAKHYLESVEALKKPNTYLKYRTVLDRFVAFLPPGIDPRKITQQDLTDFMVRLKNKHRLGNNTVIDSIIIVAQFLKRHGKPNMTQNLGLPERVMPLPREYSDPDLEKFFDACTPAERVLFSVFLFTGFREQEVVHLTWSDINFIISTVKVTAKSDLGFWAKRWRNVRCRFPRR